LSDFLLHVPIVWIKLAQCALERVDVIKLKFLFADRFYAIHDFYEPTPGLKSLISQKECPFPLGKHDLFGMGLQIAYEKDWSRRMLQPTQPAQHQGQIWRQGPGRRVSRHVHPLGGRQQPEPSAIEL